MNEKAVTVVEGKGFSLNTYAQELDGGLRFCGALLKSGMIPSHYKTPEAVLVAVLTGRELGFSPLRAVNTLYVIDGKPSLYAQALKAMAISAGGKFESANWDDTMCTIRATRGDWVEEYTYTLEDAKKAGLAERDNWRKRPKNMLYARCVAVLINNMFADVVAGLSAKEVLEDQQYLENKEQFERAPALVAKSETPAVSKYRYNIGELPAEMYEPALEYLTQNGATQPTNDLDLWESKVPLKRLERYQVAYAIADVDEETGEIVKVVAGNPELIETAESAKEQSAMEKAKAKVRAAKSAQ